MTRGPDDVLVSNRTVEPMPGSVSWTQHVGYEWVKYAPKPGEDIVFIDSSAGILCLSRVERFGDGVNTGTRNVPVRPEELKTISLP